MIVKIALFVIGIIGVIGIILTIGFGLLAYYHNAEMKVKG